jgi:hypothetical protein
MISLILADPLAELAVLTTPVNSLLPNIRSIKGMSIPKENKPNTIDKVINRLYQAI